MKRIGVILLILLCSVPIVKSQNQQIEDLQRQLGKASGTEFQDLLLKLAKEYIFINPQKSVDLADSCLQLAKLDRNKTMQNSARLMSISALVSLGAFDTVQNTLLPIVRNSFDESTDPKTYGTFYNLSAGAKLYTGQYDSALHDWGKAIAYLDNTNDSALMQKCKVNVAMVYNLKGDYQKSIDIYYEVLRKLECSSDKQAIATIYTNLAGTFSNWGNNDKALEFFQKSMLIFKEIGNDLHIGATLSNIGEIYKEKKDYSQAVKCYQEALEFLKKSNNANYTSITLLSIGEVYTLIGDYKQGLSYSEQALAIFKKMNYTEGVGRSWSNIGKSYIGLNHYTSALSAIENSQKIATQLGLPDLIIQNQLSYSVVYENIGQLDKALKAYKEYSALKDSVFDNSKVKAIAEMQTKYETEKKEQHLKLQQIEIEKNQTKQNVLIVWLVAGIVLIIIVFWAYIVKLRANFKITQQRDEIEEKNAVLHQQQEEILAQTESLEKANAEISEKKKEVEKTHGHLLKSIHYACQVQAAVLPSGQELDAIIPNYFLLFKPCDLVSGDFYWAKKQGDKLLIVVGDCTGHGIPGAMMSMYAISLLNELYSSEKLEHPEELLEKLRMHVKNEINVKQTEPNNKTLAETYFDSHIKDGIDMAACFIDLKNKILEYAGANNPAYIISNNQLVELQPVDNPIGVFIKEEPFKKVEYALNETDKIYIFTDGFIDQFGGPDNRKYNTVRFKELLMEVCQKPMPDQMGIISASFEHWKSDRIQTDDVTVLGIKI